MTPSKRPVPSHALRTEYIARVNRVLDYIEHNLDRPLPLAELAAVAHFSPFHFHRIFHAFIGETVNQFIQRIRIEKAAGLLIANPQASITEIAFNCGFSSSAGFARVFKETFTMSASRWRQGGYEQSKICKTNGKFGETVGKIRKDYIRSSLYIDPVTFNQTWRINMKGQPTIHTEVQVKDLPEQPVAYIRHIGPYKGDTQLFERLIGSLCKWAGPRGLLRFPETKFIAVYHDDPELTDQDKLRLSMCLTVPKDIAVSGEIGYMTITGGSYAVGRFELAGDEYQQAWNMLYGGWLPESGYQPDDRPCFEVYLNDPKQHPQGKCVVDICIPVKPM